jgi:outer membrane receptor protein involved in Fe transport
MDDITASIAGAPFHTWAGPVDMAVSGEWRRQTYGVSSTALPTDPVSCVGIQFNCTSTTAPYANSTANFPTAQVTVGEAAFEAQAPLLRDFAAARSLDANLAARWTDYSTSGALWSWKVGLTWAINDDLTIRVARSRDIRAPTLANLFAPYTVGTSVPLADVHITGNDPATGLPYNNNATPITISQGNPKLLPELGDTTTVGLVWSPRSIPGLSVAIDGYDIKITQGINNPSPFQPATQLACENSGGTAPVCSLYVRPLPFSNHTGANLLTQINNLLVNTGGVSTYGIDTEVNYTRLINDRRFNLRVLLNYQPHLIYDLTPAPIVDIGGSADGVNVLPATPSIKGTVQASYEVMQNLTATVQGRFRGSMTQNGNKSLIFVTNNVAATGYADLNLNYRFKAYGGDMSVYLNIRNLFDTPPVIWASTGGTGQIGTFGGYIIGDDPIGRYFKVGLTAKF